MHAGTTPGFPNSKTCGHHPDQDSSSPTQSCHRLTNPSSDHDHDVGTTGPQITETEEEYTLSAYGDISLSEIIVPPLPPPPGSGVLQPRKPQPRLRLKVRRPPMPKHRPTYVYEPDPMLPRSRDLDLDERRWPGSPGSTTNPNLSRVQHKPLVFSPLSADDGAAPSSWTWGDKPIENGGGSSLEKLVDELLSRSSSIRLSPPGRPAGRALDVSREQRKSEDDDDDALRGPPYGVPKSPPPQQDKPRSGAWRTRLPPRPPIPKWDI